MNMTGICSIRLYLPKYLLPKFFSNLNLLLIFFNQTIRPMIKMAKNDVQFTTNHQKYSPKCLKPR